MSDRMFISSFVDPKQFPSRDAELFGKQLTERVIASLPDGTWRTVDGFNEAVRNANTEIAAERDRIRGTQQGDWFASDEALEFWFTAASGYFSKQTKIYHNAYRSLR
jgi:hypothetical protein